MDDFLAAICILAILVLVVTLVGHGIWIIFAWLIRLLSGRSAPRATLIACIRCGETMAGPSGPCPICDWPAPVSQARQSVVLDILLRRVQSWSKLGLLDPVAGERITSVVAERLMHPPAPQQQAYDAPVEAALVALPGLGLPPVGAEGTPVFDAFRELPAEQSPLSAAPLTEIVQTAPPVAAPQPTPLSVAEEVAHRAAAVQARRTLAAETAPEPAAPRPAPVIRKTLWELLAAFTEERNLRWGELVGGLLIVCCSIALVISFWSQIARQPFVQFFVFNGLTAGLFGAGLYTERRLKLPSTGHGLLLISTLLVPLNFLALAVLSRDTAPQNVLLIGGEVVSLVLFAGLVHLGGRSVATGWSWPLVLGILGPSASALLVRRFIHPGGPWQLAVLLAGLPLACHAVAVAWITVRSLTAAELSDRLIRSAWSLLGMTFFSAVLPVGLAVVCTGEGVATLRTLSVLSALAGGPALSAGLVLSRRLAGEGRVLARITAMSIALVGAVVIVAGIGFAWPRPDMMVLSALAAFLVLSLLGWSCDTAAIHLLAGPAAAWGVVVAWHALSKDLPWTVADGTSMSDALASASSGTVLLPVALVAAGTAVLCSWLRRTAHAQMYGVFAAAAAVVSLALAALFGLGRTGDPAGVTWVFLTYGLMALGAACFIRHAAVETAAALLLFLGLLQGVVYKFAEPWDLSHPWIAAFTLSGGAAAILGTILGQVRRGAAGDRIPGAILLQSGLAASLVAGVMLVAVSLGQPAEGAAFRHWLALGCVWLVLSFLLDSPVVLSVSQLGLAAAACYGGLAWAARQPWSAQIVKGTFDPWVGQVAGTCLAACSLAWTGVRWTARRALQPAAAPHVPPVPAGLSIRLGDRVASLLRSDWGMADRGLIVAAVALFVAIGIVAVWPGAAQELTPRNVAAGLMGRVAAGRVVPPVEAFSPFGIPHQHALSAGSWILLGGASLALVAAQWVQFRRRNVLLLVVLLSAACGLAAGPFQQSVSAASALRWIQAGFVAVGSLAVWFREPLFRFIERLRWPGLQDRTVRLSQMAAALLLILPFSTLALMGAYPTLAALETSGPVRGVEPLFAGFSMLAGGSLIGGLLLMAWGRWVLRSPSPLALPGETARRCLAALVTTLGVAPAVILCVYVARTVLAGNPILGPDPGTFFDRIGLAGSYSIPTLGLALVLVGYAARERSHRFAFSAGLLFNAAATSGWLLSLPAGTVLNAELWVKIALLNACVSAVYTLAWTAAGALARKWKGEAEDARPQGLLLTQSMLAPALVGMATAAGVAQFFMDPTPDAIHLVLGGAWGWAALILATAGWAGLAFAGQRIPVAPLGGTGLAVLASQVAFAVARLDPTGWTAYHTLTLAWSAFALIASQAADRPLPPFRWLTRRMLGSGSGTAAWLVGLASLLVVGLCLKETGYRLQPIGWPAAGLCLAATAFVLLACSTVRHGWLYPAAGIFNLAVSIAWVRIREPLAPPGGELFMEVMTANVIALSLPCLLWAALERWHFAPSRRPAGRRGLFVHAPAVGLALGLLFFVIGIQVLADLFEGSVVLLPGITWTAVLCTVAASAARFWDASALRPGIPLYLAGLSAAGAGVDALDLEPTGFRWCPTVFLAAFALATSYLWSRRDSLNGLLRSLGAAARPAVGEEEPGWLVVFNGVLGGFVLLLGFMGVLFLDSFGLRLLAAKSVISLAVTVGLLAQGSNRRFLESASLWLGAVGAVAFGWSWLEPEASGTLLNRAVVVTVALTAVTVLYGFGIARWASSENRWGQAARRQVPWLLVAGGLSLCFVLSTEVVEFAATGRVDMDEPAILAVILSLSGMAVVSLLTALIPGRDPLGLSERGRTVYVYATEVLLALLFVHVRLSMPWLFHGFFTRYWPFIVMALAFLGMGLAEYFRRRGTRVLAEPLERTGSFLPLLPAVGVWFVPTQADYSVVLLLAGLMYGGLAAARKNALYGLFAAAALNGALWNFWVRVPGMGLLEHPQAWIIPPALCVLAAAWLNRDRLSSAQGTALRYLGASAIYTSSTADIFIHGVAQAPWLPVVLAGVSIMGVFIGIMLRVRAFLFLGISFLSLSLFTIIWHAVVDLNQTRLIWVIGIIAGVGILALFALFEKNRDRVLRAVTSLRQWDG
jgi:hypothetical protein